MPRYIVKRSPDVDEYLEFSTVVDHPTSYPMDRATMLLKLDTEAGTNAYDENRLRLDRCDKNGTSAMWPRLGPEAKGGWDSGDFYVRVEGPDRDEYPGRPVEPDEDWTPPVCWRHVPREELFDYMHAELASSESQGEDA